MQKANRESCKHGPQTPPASRQMYPQDPLGRLLQQVPVDGLRLHRPRLHRHRLAGVHGPRQVHREAPTPDQPVCMGELRVSGDRHVLLEQPVNRGPRGSRLTLASLP